MNTLLNFVLLKTFVTVAETGNFTVASQHLNSTQSTLSQQIQRLEALIGQSLFVRGHRMLTLTETGEVLFSYAKKILALNGMFFMKITGNAIIQTLRLGFPEDLASSHITPTLACFMHEQPNIRLEVTSGLSRHLHQRYQNGELDLIIIKQRKGEFKSRYCWPEPLCWLSNVDSSPLNANSIPLIVFPENGLYRNDMFRLLDIKQRAWHITYTCTSLAGIQSAITDGLGISLLPLRAKLPQHRILTEQDGFPRAEDMEIAMHVNESSEAIMTLAEQLSIKLNEL